MQGESGVNPEGGGIELVTGGGIELVTGRGIELVTGGGIELATWGGIELATSSKTVAQPRRRQLTRLW